MRLLIIQLLWVLLAGLPYTAPWQQSNEITPADLINAINTARVAYGLPALEVDPILMSTAQSTAEIMAINQMGWHIGDVSGRVMAAGYGGGAKAWATENFAVGPLTIDQLMSGPWADASHMIPVVSPNYTHIGAGVAEYNGRVYYVVHAAYTSGGRAPSTRPTSSGSSANTPGAAATPAISQIIVPVETATPGPDGVIIHEVKSGQSLWAIAIAYHTHISDVQAANNMLPGDTTVYIGQELIIPDLRNLVAPTLPEEAEQTAIALAGTEPAETAETPSPGGTSRRPTRTPLPRFTPTPTAPRQASGGADGLAEGSSQMIFAGIGVTFGLGLLLIAAGAALKKKKQ
ncbi:MAG TPA: LysM peptidoglycan-binding domain-containing protein [Chloroflexi bacterium]|jgi:LysM repeat protein|nr:LysM peptidoglycan-binding domain-containing protein [Chloroflexota bacterium]